MGLRWHTIDETILFSEYRRVESGARVCEELVLKQWAGLGRLRPFCLVSAPMPRVQCISTFSLGPPTSGPIASSSYTLEDFPYTPTYRRFAIL